MANTFLLYGSYGYTGNLIAEHSLREGLRPLLAGRDPIRLRAQAQRLGLDFRVIELADRSALDDALRATGLVVHCAGPFVLTWRQMVEACLRTGWGVGRVSAGSGSPEVGQGPSQHQQPSESRDQRRV